MMLTAFCVTPDSRWTMVSARGTSLRCDNRAVMFGYRDRMVDIADESVVISKDRVKALNNHLCNASREQVFATSVQFLEDNDYRARGTE